MRKGLKRVHGDRFWRQPRRRSGRRPPLVRHRSPAFRVLFYFCLFTFNFCLRDAFSFSGCLFYCRFPFPFLVAALRLQAPSWYKSCLFSSAVEGQAYSLDHLAAPLFDKRIAPFFHQTLRIPGSILFTLHSLLFTALITAVTWLLTHAVIRCYFRPLNPEMSIKSI